MTERIKSAIEEFEQWINRAEDFNPNVQSDHVKAMKLAIRSLQAWEEVLNQLQEWKNNAENEHEHKIVYAYISAIKIINQHLEIERE